tara:strand:- start:6716 stop:7132 length:417 start_codon:yes stop_codon:yes gene_type:complete
MVFNLDKWSQFVKESKRKPDPNDSEEVVKVVLVNDDGKILILKGPHNWELPGGHLHKGEDPISGLKREVDEEVGLNLGKVNKVAVKEKRAIYKGNLPSGEIKLSSEHTEYKFISSSELDDYDLKKIYKDTIRGKGHDE